MNDDHLDQLIDAHLNGILGPDERAELETRLLHSAADRERFWRLAGTHALLHETLQEGLGADMPERKTRRHPYWLTWRPVAAAAAGLMIGIFTVPVMYAYVVPKSGSPKAIPIVLHDGGFEAGISPVSKGIPDHTDLWSGDFSRVTGTEQGIVPGEGSRMLQVLRADHEGTPPGERSYVGEASQVIDLHLLRSSLGSHEGVVEVSARFNAITAESTEFAVKAGTFRGEIADAPALWLNPEEARSWASRSLAADSDRGTWQEVSVLLAIPEDADFLVVNFAVVGPVPTMDSVAVEFSGHFIDDVRLELQPAN